MTVNPLRPGYAKRAAARPAIVAEEPPDPVVSGVYVRALIAADHACCCTAKPAVMAIMPPSPTRRHRTELLLCMHHFRMASQGLENAGAIVLDAGGRVLSQADAKDFRLNQSLTLGPSVPGYTTGG